MSKLTRRRAILAKIETTYGTDSIPTGAANAILIKNPTITPLSSTLVDRNNIKPYLGENQQLLANTHVQVNFEVELAGAGAAGTAPAYGPLLRACGLSETVTALTDVVYAPISDSFESITMYYNVDGVQHSITGMRGTVDLDVTAKQIPFLSFKMTGIYNGPTDVALPATTYTAFQLPLVANNANTTGFSLFSTSGLILNSLKLSLNNTVDFRALIGSESAQIMERKSSGEVIFEAPSIATLDVFTKAVDTASGALALTHGTAAGNKVVIGATNITLGNVTYSDDQGVTMITAPFYAIPTSGNDELSITVE